MRRAKDNTDVTLVEGHAVILDTWSSESAFSRLGVCGFDDVVSQRKLGFRYALAHTTGSFCRSFALDADVWECDPTLSWTMEPKYCLSIGWRIEHIPLGILVKHSCGVRDLPPRNSYPG
jgi:hypothetical protein